MQNKNKMYKFIRPKGNIIWVTTEEKFGPFEFTFDKVHIYNFWTDYDKLTKEQREIFDREYPVMAAKKNPNVIVPDYSDLPEDYEEEVEYSN